MKKKICLVIPSLQAGGMERVMSELANYICKRDQLELHLILYGKTRSIFYDLSDLVLVHKPAFSFDDTSRFNSTVKTLFFLRDKVKEIRPFSILSFGEYWNSFVLIALIGLKYPIFVADRCQPSKYLGYIHERLRKYLYKKAFGVITQTSIAQEIAFKQYRHENISVIGNPIRVMNGCLKDNKENIILSVGRLIETKHYDRLINIFNDINNSSWKLVIVGGDALKQKNMVKLKQQINNLGIEDRVILAGSQKKIEEYYFKSKIFVFTSSSEGFPNVIGEALSAGLPVVSYDCVAGPSEMIIDGVNGYLVPVFDDILFQKRLQLLVDDEQLRLDMGAKAKDSIKRFSVESIGDKYLKFIMGENESNPN